MNRPRTTGRRRFIQSAMIAGFAAAFPAAARAAANRKPARPVRPAAAPAPATPPPSDEAKALAALLARRHPELDRARLDGVIRELDQRLEGGRTLRAARLPNSAEPDATFRA